MTANDWGVLVSVLSVALNLIVMLVGGARWSAKIESSIREAVAQERKEIDAELISIRRELVDQSSQSRREFGELGHALREKIREVELHIRDNFVRKETFTEVMRNTSDQLKNMGDRVETRLMRIETKFDRRGEASVAG